MMVLIEREWMKVFEILVILIAVLVIWSYIENHIFTVHTYRIKDEKIPQGFRGCRFLYLVDLHNTSYGRYNMRLKRAIEKQKPDYVLIGGDFLSRADRDFDAAIDMLAFLSQRYPTYFVNGNHETRMKQHGEMYHNVYPDFYAMAKGLNCCFLSNESCYLNRQGQRIVVDGLELPEEYFKKFDFRELPLEEMTKALGKCSSDEYHILLAHSPNYFDTYAKWGADLTLAGHNHGGMARIPFVGGVLSTQAGLFPKYTKGLYHKDGKKMIVSAGLGSHTIKVRYFNPPELLLLTLSGEGDSGKKPGAD